MRTMPSIALLLVLAALAGCASVTTRVLELKPGGPYAPSASTEILFAAPARPYTEIALLHSEGELGTSPVEVLEDLRRKAQALGADAVIVTDNQARYQPPITVYDPWFYDPFYYRNRYPYLPYGPYGDYRMLGGGYYYTAQGLAVRYRAEAPAPSAR